VDLDDLACYHAVHGLRTASMEERRIVLARCLPRFLNLFEELGVRATFFVIGRDLSRDFDAGGCGAKLLYRALNGGHELANHSYSHAYDLASWPVKRIAHDLKACDALLRKLGANPVGFRAPGYTHNHKLLSEVAALGYRYDSSALPSPPYYLAKLGVMGWMALHRRRSQSTARGSRSFFGAKVPRYLEKYRIWEIPMSVSSYLRLPMIGTMLLAGPEPLAGLLHAAAARQRYFHLELHGLDLADSGDEHNPGDGYGRELTDLQPELRVPLSLRLERLRTLLTARGSAEPIMSMVET
jgi:peptidoglycan-N-acetylglucosamine deacetylase